jgi:serine/threonine protein kinase
MLRPGDQLLSVAGDGDAGFYGPALALARVPYGALFPLQAQRGNTRFTVFLPISHSQRSEWRDYLPNLFLAFLVCAAAVYIAALRWSNLSARIAAIAFITNGLAMAATVLVDYPGWGRLTSAIAMGLISFHRPLELPLIYDFCSRFPRSVEEASFARLLRQSLYVLAALLWIPFNVPVLAHIAGASPTHALAALMPFRPDGQYGSAISAGFESTTALFSCLVLIRNYLRIRTPDSRLRMRWAGLAIASSLSTFLLFALLKLIWDLTGSDVARKWSLVVDEAGAFVVGLSFVGLTYAVAKYRVFGIRVAIRQGLRYLLAKNVLRSMIFLPFLIVAGKAIGNPDKGLRDLLLQSSWPSYSALAAAGVIGLRYQVQIRPWLDRRFFRAALGQEQVLVTLMDSVKEVESEEDLCLIVGRELDEALHVDGCHVFLGDLNDRLRVAYSQTPDRAARLRDWLNQNGVELLKANSPFMLYEVEESILDGHTYTSEPAEHLVIPVSGGGLNRVALAFGPKRSEQPYTRRDNDLLKSVAGQMATVREVLQLKKSVEQERRTRVQVLGRLDHQQVRLLTECPDCGRCYTTAESTCAEDGVSLSLTLPVERMIDGKYLLERRLGRGGMGVVYRANDIGLNRPVAIKMMVGDLFGNTAAISRFSREARAVAALSHPNIVAVYDFGRLPAGGSYLVMELVNGEPWRKHLTRGRGMTPQRAYISIRQLCEAVEAAHFGGVIHRDLKPENIMIADDLEKWRVVVLDFGLARFRADLLPEEPNLTATRVVMGTLGYMSPEQRSGRKVGPDTDVYSVAVICAETITGRRPPPYGASPEWLKSAFRDVLPGHEQLFHVTERALARNPGQRSSLRDFVECLSKLESLSSEPPVSPVSLRGAEALTCPTEIVNAGIPNPECETDATETVTSSPESLKTETLTPRPEAPSS